MTRRYSAYRDSGIHWLGQIPERWETRRFKTVLREREERSSDGSEVLLSVSAYTGVTPRSQNIDEGDFISRAESLEGYKVCYPNDLVMNIMLAWNRAQGVSPYGGIVSPAYAVFELAPAIHPPYLNYLVRSNEYCLYFKAHSAGVIDSRLRLYPEQFGALHCIFPPLPEQTAIAAFLDRETAKIDALVAEQRRLIDLLREKRQAVISHAVTRGLNPNAKLKPSGVDWLGDVPEGWEVKRLSQVCDFDQGKAHEPYFDDDGDYICVTARFVSTDGKNFKRCSVNLTLARRGDILMVMSDLPNGRALARSYLVREDNAFAVNQRVCRIAPINGDSRFYAYQLNRNEALLSEDDGLNQTHLSNASFTKLNLLVPPLSEQTAIGDYLDQEVGRFDALTASAESAIKLFDERRAALISAAVTGKIDVRDLVAQTEAA